MGPSAAYNEFIAAAAKQPRITALLCIVITFLEIVKISRPPHRTLRGSASRNVTAEYEYFVATG
jgi:hypothetical protein